MQIIIKVPFQTELHHVYRGCVKLVTCKRIDSSWQHNRDHGGTQNRAHRAAVCMQYSRQKFDYGQFFYKESC